MKEEQKEDEDIRAECCNSNCKNTVIFPKYIIDKKDYYCSEGCRYNEETGFSGEEY